MSRFAHEGGMGQCPGVRWIGYQLRWHLYCGCWLVLADFVGLCHVRSHVVQRQGSQLFQRGTSQSACEGWMIGICCWGGGRRCWL